MKIENIIEHADDGRKKERDFDKLEGIMVWIWADTSTVWATPPE